MYNFTFSTAIDVFLLFKDKYSYTLYMAFYELLYHVKKARVGAEGFEFHSAIKDTHYERITFVSSERESNPNYFSLGYCRSSARLGECMVCCTHTDAHRQSKWPYLSADRPSARWRRADPSVFVQSVWRCASDASINHCRPDPERSNGESRSKGSAL